MPTALPIATDLSRVIARQVPTSVRSVAKSAGVAVTEGIPSVTWNGMDDAGKLFTGLHPASIAELELRFAYNPDRAKLFNETVRAAAHLHEGHGVRWVAGGGSMFSYTKAVPNDVDLAVFLGDSALSHNALRRLSSRFTGVEMYQAEIGHRIPGGPNFISKFSRQRDGSRAGMVLFDAQEAARLVRS